MSPLTPAQTLAASRAGFDRAAFLLDQIDSLAAEKRAEATRKTIRDLCCEYAELMASIKRPKPLPAVRVDPRDNGDPYARTKFGDWDRPSRHVGD